MSIYTSAKLLYVSNVPAHVRDEILSCFTDVYELGDAVQIDADSLEENLDNCNSISDKTRCILNAIVSHNLHTEQAQVLQLYP
jgi:broad-specificity NMP kinase